MLSPGESFSHRNSGVSRRGFTHSLPPQSFPSVASVTSVRCFPLATRSRTETVGVFRRGFPHSLRPNQSPSVASVTSVRCFPLASRSRTETVVSPGAAFLTASVPMIPLCGLRDLCAMLSLGESFSHRNSGVFRRGFPLSLRPNQSPSAASVTSMRCFPLASRSRTEAVVSPDTASLPASVTSVRCIPLASRSRTETVVSPDAASLTASVPINPPLWPL
jgi:hypothetical protein